MKQALILAALGSVYALAALLDAPIVYQAMSFCAVGLVSYAGPGWFAACSAAFAAILLATAFYRVLTVATIKAPPRAGVEMLAPMPVPEPALIIYLGDHYDIYPAVIGSG